MRDEATDTQAGNIYLGDVFRHVTWRASGRKIKPVIFFLGGAKWDGDGRQKVITRIDLGQS